MCFKAKTYGEVAKLAVRDIAAYKFFKFERGVYKSPYKTGYRWQPETIHTTGLVTKLKRLDNDIHRGFHCYKTKLSSYNSHYLRSIGVLLKVIIPAGAYYFDNGSEYVSNEMVLVGKRPIKFK